MSIFRRLIATRLLAALDRKGVNASRFSRHTSKKVGQMSPGELSAWMQIPHERAMAWADPLSAAMEHCEINTIARQLAFIATINHESAGLSQLRENLNYSAKALAYTWKTRFRFPRFDIEERQTQFSDGMRNALLYAHKPMAIANAAYELREGNGSEASGDGWVYRGGGPIMRTFRGAYRSDGQKLGFDLEANPELIERPVVGSLVAALCWKEKGCNEAADEADFDKVCDLVNRGLHTQAFGDAIGFSGRLEKLKIAVNAMLSH